MQEARAASRHRRRLKVTVGTAPSFTTDVSAGGFCMELLGRVLPPGAPLDGTIQVKGGAIAFHGQVVWAKRGDWHLNVRGKMGVRFTQISPELLHLADLHSELAHAVQTRA